MQLLSRAKLQKILGERQLTLSQTARESAISRQSLYKMIGGEPIYNTPFLKLIRYLKVGPEEVTDTGSRADFLLQNAPTKIRKSVLELSNFCEHHQASLFLFGSQARGANKIGSDWDFGIFFRKKDEDRSLRRLKQNLQSRTFPYRIDVLNLGQAPSWFLESIQEESILLKGKWPKLFKRKVA